MGQGSGAGACMAVEMVLRCMRKGARGGGGVGDRKQPLGGEGPSASKAD